MAVGLSTEGASGSGAPSRRKKRTLSIGHLAVAMAAILAFVANLAFLRAKDEAVAVVAAARSLEVGHVVTASDLTTVGVRADPSVLATLLTSTEGLEGRVVRHALEPGALVGSSDLLTEAAPGGLRSMAIPIAPAHAAGGGIRPGDRVDVVDVVEGVATYVVRDAPVLEVSSRATGALTVAAGDFLVIGLAEGEVLAVAEAIADGKVDVVVTTGAADG